MNVIPVIDLLRGQVVRGVGGRRSEYRPIVSSLVTGSEPAVIAAALQERFGLTRMYVADLDSIQGGSRDLESWRAIAAVGWQLTIDAGLKTADEVLSLCPLLRRDFPSAEVVIGLETFRELAELGGVMQVCTANRQQAVFSLDLKSGELLTADPKWRGVTPLELMAEVYRCGLRRTIVLDLADVGSGQGTSTLPLVGQLRQQFPDLEIIAGGGVRGPADLRQLKLAGVSGALVASALHDGRITPADLQTP